PRTNVLAPTRNPSCNTNLPGRPVLVDLSTSGDNSARRIGYSAAMVAKDSVPARDDATRSLMRDRERAPLPVVIKVVAGGQGASYRLAGGSCVLGAGRDADLVVDGATVSRRHAELMLDAEGVLVRDLDSRNGTFYLGQRVREL